MGGGEAKRTHGPLDGWDEQSLGSGRVGVEEAGGRGRGASRLRVEGILNPSSRCGTLSHHRQACEPVLSFFRPTFSSFLLVWIHHLAPLLHQVSPSLFGLDPVVRSVHFRTALFHASLVRLLGFN